MLFSPKVVSFSVTIDAKIGINVVAVDDPYTMHNDRKIPFP